MHQNYLLMKFLLFIACISLRIESLAQKNVSVSFEKWISLKTVFSPIISPDGKSVVYTAMAGSSTSMWRRDLETGRSFELTPSISGMLGSLAFTANATQVAFVNFPPKQIGPFRSEVLVLGAYDEAGEVILLDPDKPVAPGSKIG